jgi:hypothetical protein
LRKVRWALAGRGKRGGVSVIYYWAVKAERLLMLSSYAKTEQTDATPSQVAIQRRIIEAEQL